MPAATVISAYSVIEGRINGNLNLSRAIGDMEYKKDLKLKPEDQIITAAPDVKKRVYNLYFSPFPWMINLLSWAAMAYGKSSPMNISATLLSPEYKKKWK